MRSPSAVSPPRITQSTPSPTRFTRRSPWLRWSRSPGCLDRKPGREGSSLHNSVAGTTEAEFDAVMRVHLRGPYFLTQRLLPLLADGARILNVSSGLARFSTPGFAAYAMMKGGIEVFTRYLAAELASRGITANTLAPGAIETDFSGGIVRDNPDVNRMVSQNTAPGRPGRVSDIGPVVAALVSADNRWINGQRIEASGGMRL